MNKLQVNADRFLGLAGIYDKVRPKAPDKMAKLLITYLREKPSCVVDLGCGTGLSSLIWCEVSSKVIGIEPNKDMLKIAETRLNSYDNLQFFNAFSDETGLADNCADIITCSQSFHWMDPGTTLKEVDRILKPGGIFAVYDCDWPPVCHWEAENEFNRLFDKVNEIEMLNKGTDDISIRWNKDYHLSNIRRMGKFRYTREIVFSNTENCNAERFIAIALSPGGLQAVLRSGIGNIDQYVNMFKDKITEIFSDRDFEIDWCYRMRVGVK